MFNKKMANDLIGSKIYNCVEFVVLVQPEFYDYLQRYANPNSKFYNLKLANEYAKERLIRYDLSEIEYDEYYLVSFETEIGTSGHVGLYYNDYIYHSDEKLGIIAQPIHKCIKSNLRYTKFSFYKIMEN